MAKSNEYIDSPFLMEPMLPEDSAGILEDRVAELLKKASYLAGSLRPEIANSIGTLVRSMNCYYSNLIEGHNTHPHDIDRALHDNYSANPEKRVLQLEATAHIAVQEMIDRGEATTNPASWETLRWIHQEFYSRLPEELLWVTNPNTHTRLQVEAGKLRTGEVKVERHFPPIANSLPHFLQRFEQAYDPAKLSPIKRVIAVAAAQFWSLPNCYAVWISM